MKTPQLFEVEIGNKTGRARARTIGRTISFIVVVAVSALLFFGCETVPKNVPQGLSQAELFQRAQNAADKSNWKTALVYYQTFLDRYPNDTPNVAAAKYEIAFIHFRLGELKLSQKEFQDLLKLYDGTDANQLPQWPKVLSNDILKNIDAKLSPAKSRT